LITPAAVQLVHERVKEAVSKGAVVRTGGYYKEQIYKPTVLTDVPPDATLASEETFGPVVFVEPFDTVEEAVQSANRTMYGLAASSLRAIPTKPSSWHLASRLASSTSTRPP
jgi:acyl-CoA reductase-like NAD-dependent aldehyde dehydrogenase